jgi:hypothetical protein
MDCPACPAPTVPPRPGPPEGRDHAPAHAPSVVLASPRERAHSARSMSAVGVREAARAGMAATTLARTRAPPAMRTSRRTSARYPPHRRPNVARKRYRETLSTFLVPEIHHLALEPSLAANLHRPDGPHRRLEQCC